MKSEHLMYTNWDKQNLICACMVTNPKCGRFQECEKTKLSHDPYADVNSCMKTRSYKRKKGVIRQVGFDG